MTVLLPDSEPELGPLLGRLASLADRAAPQDALLSPVRLELITGVFERAGWIPVWERAVAETERVVSAEIEARLSEAARVSRYPPKRLRRLLPTSEDRRIFAARLSATGIGFEDAVATLEESRGNRGPEHLRRTCGELEAAWDRLLGVAGDELARWDRQAAMIRAWRRPWTGLIVATALTAAAALWLGLVLGGYLNAPSWLLPFAEWFWSR